MSKNLQGVFFFFFCWAIISAFNENTIIKLLGRFDFVLVFISAYYLIKLTLINKSNSIDISFFYKFIMGLLLIWIFLNIFRDPPQNPNGFIRFLGGRYYLGAWFPLLFFYLGAKIKIWSQIWHYALKFNKLIIISSPLIVFLFLTGGITWSYVLFLVFLFPILIVNWDLLNGQERFFLGLTIILVLFLSIFGGSRFLVLKTLFYLPIMYFLLFLKKKSRNIFRIFNMSFVLLGVYLLGFYIYNGGLDFINVGESDANAGIYKFTSQGFKNSRKEYAYPDYFADMKSTQDWVFGRGINGSYYSEIFETSVDKDLKENNSLGVKKGYRPNIECGYLQVILKIGLLGLFLKLLLALPAIYLGLFKSKNWFVRGCAIVIVEWLISMYPAALPEWSISYMLLWLCIGACLSKETRNATSSMFFIAQLNDIRKRNKSFFLLKNF